MRMRVSVFGPLLLAALITVGAGCTKAEPAETDSGTSVEQGMPVPGSQTPEMEVNGSAAGGTQLEGTPAVNDTPDAAIEVETSPATTTTTPTPAPAPAAVKSFTVNGSNFSFDLKEMKVKKGDKVRVTFKNAEGFHDWKLDAFGAATGRLQAGGSETVEFTADKAGTFEYYCSVGSHRAMGMKGNLIVE